MKFAIDSNGHLRLTVALCLVVPMTLLILVQAFTAKFDSGPDEYDHYAAAEYFVENLIPPPVGHESIRYAYSRYGYSYLDNYEVLYLLAGKWLHLTSFSGVETFYRIRLFNVGLWGMLMIPVLAIPRFRICSLFAAVSPETWYLFTYFNVDAFSLCVGVFLCFALAEKEKLAAYFTPLYLILVLLLFLSKSNYLVLIGFSYFVLCAENGFKFTRKQINYLAAVGICLAVMFLGRMGLDYWITGPDKIGQRLEIVEELATPAFHPDNLGKPGSNTNLRLREQGISLWEVLVDREWLILTCKDAAGFFGNHEFAFAVPFSRILAAALPLALGVWLIVLFTSAPLYLRFILVAATGTLLLNLLASLMISWTIDFQPQFRYILPGILAILFVMLRYEWGKKLRLLILTCLPLFALSLISFYIAALHALPRNETYELKRDPMYYQFGDEEFWESEEIYNRKRGVVD